MSVYSKISLFLLALLFAGCANFPTSLEEPQVKVTSLRLMPSQGMEQRIAVGLSITNPNGRDLSIRGMSYSIGIENFDLLSGVTSQVPTLRAYEETPVTVEISANLLSIARLVEYFSRRGVEDDVDYRFRAKLDFNRWLPSMRVEEQGSINLRSR